MLEMSFPCDFILVCSYTANAGAHVQLAVFAHCVGIPLRPTIVGFNWILQAVVGCFLLVFDTIQLFNASQQTQSGLGTGSGLVKNRGARGKRQNECSTGEQD